MIVSLVLNRCLELSCKFIKLAEIHELAMRIIEQLMQDQKKETIQKKTGRSSLSSKYRKRTIVSVCMRKAVSMSTVAKELQKCQALIREK